MKKQILFTPLLLTLSLGFTSCGKQEEEEITTEDVISDSVEAAITSLGGAADDQGNETYASYKPSLIQKLLMEANPIKSAHASTCSGRAVAESCSSGVRAKSYSECSIGLSNHTLNGGVTLTYTDNACDMSTDGDTVTRTFSYTRTTPFGAVVTKSSDDNTDFDGSTYGGGSKLEKTTSGYDLTILGKHKKRVSARGKTRFDISVKTNGSVSMNQLTRDGRIMNGGAIEVAHNLAKYKVSMAPVNLEYRSDCCYPVGGSMNLTYSGAVEGSGSVTFTSCGQATVSKDADNYDIEFYSCE